MDSTVLFSDLVCIVFSSDTANKCFRASWTPLYTPCKHGQLFVLHCTADYYPAPACHKFRKSERLWTESPTCWCSYRSKSNGNALVRSMLPKSNDVRKQSALKSKIDGTSFSAIFSSEPNIGSNGISWDLWCTNYAWPRYLTVQCNCDSLCSDVHVL